jgi:tetratricopeptide (TPR) repeat protein
VPLGLTAVSLGAFGRQPSRLRHFGVWFSFVPAYAVSIALFFVADRYRLPLMVPLCVCAGGAIDFAVSAITAQRARQLALPALALGALLAAVNYPVALDDGRWTEGLRTAERLVISQRYEEAERWAEWLETHHPPRPGAGQLGVAQQLMALGQHERALPYVKRAIQADPNEPHAQYALGQTLLKLGRAAEAVPHLRQGFDAGIELPSGGEDYARALVDSGDLPGAVAALRRIHPAESADAETWLRLGRLAMESKAPETAQPFFEHVARMQPNDAATRQQYGLNLLVLNRFEDAARELSEAVRLDPRNVDSLSRLAYAETRLGRSADARRHAQAALAIDPNDPLARQLAGVLR